MCLEKYEFGLQKSWILKFYKNLKLVIKKWISGVNTTSFQRYLVNCIQTVGPPAISTFEYNNNHTYSDTCTLYVLHCT